MKLINELGNRYGNLLVVERVVDPDKKNNKTSWKCACDCGNTLTTWGPQLRGSKNRPGQTKCKDCRNKEFADRGKALQSSETIIKDLQYRYKNRAQKKNLEFSLTLDRVRELVTAPCHYCGMAPFALKRKHSQSMFYTGIDRIDNTLGYTPENTVPCCKQCNQAKMDYSEADFLSWLKRLYEHTYGRDNSKTI